MFLCQIKFKYLEFVSASGIDWFLICFCNKSIEENNLHYAFYLAFMNNIYKIFILVLCVYSFFLFLQKTYNTLNKNQSYYILNICNCTVLIVNNNVLEYNCISIIASQIYTLLGQVSVSVYKIWIHLDTPISYDNS